MGSASAAAAAGARELAWAVAVHMPVDAAQELPCSPSKAAHLARSQNRGVRLMCPRSRTSGSGADCLSDPKKHIYVQQ